MDAYAERAARQGCEYSGTGRVPGLRALRDRRAREGAPCMSGGRRVAGGGRAGTGSAGKLTDTNAGAKATALAASAPVATLLAPLASQHIILSSSAGCAAFAKGEGTAKPSIVFCTLRERLGVVVWCRKAGERKKTEGLKSTWPNPALPGMAGEACGRRRARTACFNNRTACAAAGLTVL